MRETSVPDFVRNELVVYRGGFIVCDKSLTSEVLKEQIESQGLSSVVVTPHETEANRFWFSGVARFGLWFASNLQVKLWEVLHLIAPSVWPVGPAPIPELIPAPAPMKQRRPKAATA